MNTDAFGALDTFEAGQGPVGYYRLGALEREGLTARLDALPFSIKVLLESVLRNVDGELVTEPDVRRLAAWTRSGRPTSSCPSCPRASSCRTSRACPRSWTSRPCARRSSGWA